MPNYKETTLTGESYQRSHRVIIENKKGDTPHITFLEEQLTTLSDGTELHRDVNQITVYFDPNGVFDLYNPVTDAPMGGTDTHVHFQILLYSLYKHYAKLRDEAVPA